ncbi:hypothetical protein VTN02DRAFT_3149 [Thermoascus thermophilus]
MADQPSSHSLYGIQRPKNTATKKDLTSSSTLAFTTHLSSLISKKDASDASTTRGRARPSKSAKPDIFSVHNKGAQKRAAADEAADHQGYTRSEDTGQVDAATLHRSKRRMEEKARMYEDLKRGAHLEDSSEDEQGGDDYAAKLRRKERNALVDFDRKWAENEAARMERGDPADEEDEEEQEADADAVDLVEYEDEFGRTRTGTRAEAARAARLKQQQDNEARGIPHDRSRPARPENLIHGATIQTQAFNPDAAIAEKMSYLASRRDRSPTPPEETHYDPEAEVRTRGTGFYAFSRDKEQREREMEELMQARKETEREREARRERMAERERIKDERRRKIKELRGKRQAEMFLEGLGDLGGLAATAQAQGGA